MLSIIATLLMVAQTLYFGDAASDTPYRDMAGRPLAGAVLTFYRSGTTAPIPVYTGASLAIEHEVPITANNLGVFSPIYLDPDDLPCRVKLERADGTLVWDVDPYIAIVGESEEHVDVFTESGSFEVPNDVSSIDAVLVVAGGGAGGGSAGSGGGGGGGVLFEEDYSVTPGASVSVVVGSGGTAVTGERGNPGGNSSFGDLEATGGGGGGAAGSDSASGGDGGSGGGAGWSAGLPLPGSGVEGQGNDGGNSAAGSGGAFGNCGGGGGGAGGAGENAQFLVKPGDGGAGVDLSAMFGESVGASGWFGAGGAGGGQVNVAQQIADGGQGGGGETGQPGQDGTGGGGGGRGNATGIGEGGSGVVILKYGGTAPGVLFLSPVFQPAVSDAVLPGAELKFFLDDAIAAVYANGDATAPLTHPVVADAGGYFPPIYLTDGEEGAQLKNASGTVVFGPADNPVPAISALSPASADEGDDEFTLTVTGTGFIEDSVVRWNGAARTTTYVSPTELQATIPSTDVADPGLARVTVFNPPPIGGESLWRGFVTEEIPDNPVPALTDIDPDAATEGDPGFTLTLTGTGFIATSVVRWDGSDRATTYVSPTELKAAILTGDIDAAGTFDVTVFNPAPGGGESNAETFDVESATDPDFSSVVSLLHFDGADGSTTIVDVTGKSWSATGNAQLDTAQKKFGTASLLTDGAGDYISTSSSTDFSLTASGDFTVEFWLYLTDKDNSDGNAVVCVGNASGYWQFLVRSNQIQINLRNATGGAFSDLTASQTLANGQWHHYAWTRASGTNRLFYDGVQLTTSGSLPSNPTQGTHAAYVGANYNGGATSTAGQIDDVRITKGVARYTSNFTPPTAPFPDA